MEQLYAAVLRWRGQTAIRLIAGVTLCVMLYTTVPGPLLVDWLAGYVLLQAVCTTYLSAKRLDEFRAQGVLSSQVVPWFGVQSGFFCVAATASAMSASPLGLALAIGTVGGSLTNSVAISGSSRRLFLASAAPGFFTGCFAIPTIVWLHSHQATEVFVLGFSGLLSIGLTASIWRYYADVLLSETQARQQAHEANLAKGRFVAMISHEIRTPLNAMLGMAQVMDAGDLSVEQRARLKVVQDSGDLLLVILNDVLDLSKIEAGKFNLEAIEFDLDDLLYSTRAAFSAIATTKGIAFDFASSQTSGLFVGDPTRLRQILSNLLSNALKFTHSGDIGLEARWADNELEVSVADTGIGIAPDVLRKLFSEFTQADTTTAREYGGTGLGLSICRNLAVAMGGHIEVESEVGRGSRFTFSVPLCPARGEIAQAVPEPSGSGLSADFGNGLRLLAAEDNPTNQLVLKTILAQAGITPTLVDTGKAAVDAWIGEEWDVILMDVEMPEMDGPTAVRRIRELERLLRRPATPILALSANAMPAQRQEYLAAGMDGCIEKPIVIAELFTSLEVVLYKDKEALQVALAG